MNIATDRPEETWRFERLTSVEGSISEFRPDISSKIDEIHDHEGCLSVYWNTISSISDMEFVEQMWKAQDESWVEHYTPASKIDIYRRVG